MLSFKQRWISLGDRDALAHEMCPEPEGCEGCEAHVKLCSWPPHICTGPVEFSLWGRKLRIIGGQKEVCLSWQKLLRVSSYTIVPFSFLANNRDHRSRGLRALLFILSTPQLLLVVETERLHGCLR